MAMGCPKTDRRDARWLALMGAKGVLPEVYVICPETERLRELLRHRSTWIRDRTRVKNRIHYQLAHEQHICPHRSVFSRQGQAWLEQVRLTAPYDRSLTHHRAHYTFVDAQVTEATAYLLAQSFDEVLVHRLESIPGVGALTARTLLAEIETIGRFPSPERLISYAGLAPRVRQSSAQDRRGALTKRGSVWLRTALIEATQVAVRRPNQFQRVFYRVAFRRGRNVGIVAAARRLTTVVWHVWSKNTCYQEPPQGAVPESRCAVESVATA
jgi:transposase